MRHLRLEYPTNLALDGSGYSLELTFDGCLRRRRAKSQGAKVTVMLSRSNIRCLLESIAKMHERDRERLRQEAKRIDNEKAAILGGTNG
jgi:hypothetical protein